MPPKKKIKVEEDYSIHINENTLDPIVECLDSSSDSTPRKEYDYDEQEFDRLVKEAEHYFDHEAEDSTRWFGNQVINDMMAINDHINDFVHITKEEIGTLVQRIEVYNAQLTDYVENKR